MRKILLIMLAGLFICTTANLAQAQGYKPGQFIDGVYAGFGTGGFVFGGSFEYGIIDLMGIKCSVDFSPAVWGTLEEGEKRTPLYNMFILITPGASFHFLPGNALDPFAGGGLSIIMWTPGTYQGQEYVAGGIVFGGEASGGLRYWLNDRIALGGEARIRFTTGGVGFTGTGGVVFGF